MSTETKSVVEKYTVGDYIFSLNKPHIGRRKWSSLIPRGGEGSLWHVQSEAEMGCSEQLSWGQIMGSLGERYQTQFYVLWHNGHLWTPWRNCHKLVNDFFPLFSISHFFFGSEVKLVDKKTPLK